MPAKQQRGGSSDPLLDPVPLPLVSRHYSIAAPSPSRYGKRYEVEGRTNFLELRWGEVRRIPLLRTRMNKGKKKAGVLVGLPASSSRGAASLMPLGQHQGAQIEIGIVDAGCPQAPGSGSAARRGVHRFVQRVVRVGGSRREGTPKERRRRG